MEILDLYTADREKTGKTMVRGEETPAGCYRLVVHVCIFNDKGQLLIQQQPVARDLRTITAAMKMVTDMERIGDQAADISELTVVMADKPYQINTDHIKKMAAETILMLRKAVEAYVERDIEKAVGKPTLSSPRFGAAELKKALQAKGLM